MSGTSQPIGFCVECYQAWYADYVANGRSEINYQYGPKDVDTHLGAMHEAGTPHSLGVTVVWVPDE